MKLPNFRLYETQARFGSALGVSGVVLLLVLAYSVFHGFTAQEMVIPYNSKEGLGQYRQYLVLGLGGLSLGTGFFAALLGFGSLGQKRNPKQGLSWLGLALGAFVMAAAPVLLFAWMKLREDVI